MASIADSTTTDKNVPSETDNNESFNSSNLSQEMSTSDDSYIASKVTSSESDTTFNENIINDSECDKNDQPSNEASVEITYTDESPSREDECEVNPHEEVETSLSKDYSGETAITNEQNEDNNKVNSELDSSQIMSVDEAQEESQCENEASYQCEDQQKSVDSNYKNDEKPNQHETQQSENTSEEIEQSENPSEEIEQPETRQEGLMEDTHVERDLDEGKHIEKERYLEKETDVEQQKGGEKDLEERDLEEKDLEKEKDLEENTHPEQTVEESLTKKAHIESTHVEKTHEESTEVEACMKDSCTEDCNSETNQSNENQQDASITPDVIPDTNQQKESSDINSSNESQDEQNTNQPGDIDKETRPVMDNGARNEERINLQDKSDDISLSTLQKEITQDNSQQDSRKTTSETLTLVNLEKEGAHDKDVSIVPEEDPIASVFASNNDGEGEQNAEQGADEELCIIPDTERIISQAEKEAASALPTLRDLSEASAALETPDEALRTDSSTRKTNDSTHNSEIRVKDLTSCKEQNTLTFVRKCAHCKKKTDNPDVNLSWEIMDFCNEFCLSKYQREIGSKCSSCSTDVRPSSLGKYCVRFGNDIRQFCTSHCLEEYKKGLKVCSYCQQDISKGSEGFLAPVGDKGHFKDFCSQKCMEKYDVMTNDRIPKVDSGTKCFVCNMADKPITIEFHFNNQDNYFCGEPCFVAFSFVNKIASGKCAMCRRNFSRQTLEKCTMFYDNVQHSFCSNSCQNIYIIAHRKIVPCSWCKVKKYNFDMIRRYSCNNDVLNMCSVNCYSLYQVSMNAVSSKKITCDYCLKNMQPMYHLTMSDATIRSFCSYSCVMSFQSQFPKAPITISSTDRVPIVPTGIPKRSKRISQSNKQEEDPRPVISSNVQNFASSNGVRTTRSKSNLTNSQPVVNNGTDGQQPVSIQIRQQIIIKPRPIPEQRNVGTLVRARCFNKSTQSTKPATSNKEIQTETRVKDKILIPVPVPIYVPTPGHMYNAPTVIPIPIPVPVPIPIFIPTTRNSANGIMKEIKKIQVKIPSDPYEAELLMMAEMVADDKKEENTDSESDLDETTAADDGHFSPEPVDASNTFGDDMLQMALKMATELDEPAVDLEGALTANTITAPQGEGVTTEEQVEDPQAIHLMERQSMRGRKRGMRQGRHHPASKRGRRVSNQPEMPIMTPVQPPPPPEPVEKPDANMCLKYTFGVNAWKQWVTTKNTELEKSSRRVKLFKTEILQLTADELNYSLCLFVKEVRKPNGAEYAPDTIYYLCLGIQQYLFENGRIDNIFCDPYYEKFTDCLDEVARKFSVLYNDSHYIVTRVEEEHLWESKQLGAHSPHVLLSTLMFFNTKHFNLTTVDEHMQLSFSHIMKHWKRNPNQPGASKVPGSRNVLLRFYPPQSAIQNNARKKKVYEQQENEENPLRCPVKLYEFYLSKCPESVKTRNDVFYLQPERSCVPDSPVWYSTMPLRREALEKMLHRVKMVKEINVALLTS